MFIDVQTCFDPEDCTAAISSWPGKKRPAVILVQGCPGAAMFYWWILVDSWEVSVGFLSHGGTAIAGWFL